MNRTAVHPAQRCACHGRVKQSCFTLPWQAHLFFRKLLRDFFILILLVKTLNWKDSQGNIPSKSFQFNFSLKEKELNRSPLLSEAAGPDPNRFWDKKPCCNGSGGYQ